MEIQKKGILFIIPWMVMGGADRFNLDFVRLLNKNKYRITIVTTVPSDNEWKQLFREFTSEVFTLSDFLDVSHYAEFISYIIDTRRIDVCMISNSYLGYYLAPWLRREYPELAMVDYVHMEEMYWRKGGYARTSAAMSDILEKTYVCNNATKNKMCQVFGKSQDSIETIYIGVDQEKYNPKNVEYGLVRKKYNIDTKRKIVLFPCRLHLQKRPYLMVEIANEIIKKRRDICFLVVGDGGELNGVQEKVKAYRLEKYFVFAGAQDNMLPYYKDSDITLICSIREGLSLTAYESCAMMTPVITSDVGGQKELVDDNIGRVIPLLQKETDIHNFEYEKEEIELYVNAILDIFLDEKKYLDMCINCRRKIENDFGLDSMIKNMESALESAFTAKRVNERKMKATAMKTLSKMADDVFSVYSAYEGSEQEIGKLWRENCRLEKEKQLALKCSSEFETECSNLWHSNSFKIGRFITWGPRMMRGGIKCINEHGIFYTLKYLLKKWK